LLGLKVLPARIEAFDISHTGGEEPVGSMVVFENGLPNRGEYRHFKVQYAPGRDDCAQISEVVHRRYRRVLEEKRELPDLILVDGGAGQLRSALNSLRELGIINIPVIGFAKQFEHVFSEKASEPIVLPPNSSALQLIRHIRDDAHRFAIGFHYELRGRKIKESILDYIPGLGEEKKKLLLRHFCSVEAIKEAKLAELQKVKGVGPHLAKRIREQLSAKDS
jgi:excinuclease ABC subunit C